MIGVLQGLKGVTADTVYDLFFTEKKIVAAIVYHPSDMIKMYKPDLLTVFIGGLPRFEEIKMRSRKMIDERRLTFKNKSIDEILAMDKANFELDYEDIDSVTIKKSLFSRRLEFRVDKHPLRKIVFSLEKDQVPEVQKLMITILRDKFIKPLGR